MKSVTIKAFKEILNAEKSNNTVKFINVCTPLEFKEKHIRGVENIPLDELTYRLAELKGKKTIYVHCKSGNRSQKAISLLSDMGIEAELVNVEGGLNAWENENLPTGSDLKRLPVIRQVFITAGTFTMLGSLAALSININFIILPILIGCGLIFAGVTGWCGMAKLLGKMPWNR